MGRRLRVAGAQQDRPPGRRKGAPRSADARPAGNGHAGIILSGPRQVLLEDGGPLTLRSSPRRGAKEGASLAGRKNSGHEAIQPCPQSPAAGKRRGAGVIEPQTISVEAYDPLKRALLATPPEAPAVERAAASASTASSRRPARAAWPSSTRPRPGAPPPRRAQGPPGRFDRARRHPPAPSGGRDRRAAAPPQHRPHPRGRHGARPLGLAAALHRHGLREGRTLHDLIRERTRRELLVILEGRRRRGRLRPRAGGGPSRSQARQRPDRRRRPRDAGRLRAGPGRQFRHAADPFSRRHGDAGLHGPRAGRGTGARGRRPVGRLRARGHPLRDPRRPAALLLRHAGERLPEDPLRRAVPPTASTARWTTTWNGSA